ncbi:MAG: rRNA pseudouridine synthase [Bacteroidales bacterium]|nr:rRNA pseudouridine synthase [Bacteroidales bacterium]
MKGKRPVRKSISGSKDHRSAYKERSTSTDKNNKRSVDREEGIRLNRYLASTGLCSRREADEFIKAGLITVNGKTISEFGTRVFSSDDVRYNGEKLKTEKPVYVLLNKPKDYVTTTKDPFAKKTVLDLVRNAGKQRIFPVGRLDRNTTGVLLLTNDGELTDRLTHPGYNKMKIYNVTLNKSLRGDHMKQILEGFDLEDGFIKADAINYVDLSDKKQIGIELHSGRNKIVRRIFEHLGYEIRKLDRVYFAGLTKKGLTRGKWRYLSDKEISMLKIGVYK